jgi:competence protein ComEA
MIKPMLLVVALMLALTGAAFGAVDVNSADEAALTSVKGIGPSLARTIVTERGKQGAFKDASDLAERVKGLGQKSVVRLQNEGLTIGARAAPAVAAKKDGKAEKAEKVAKADKADKAGGKTAH